MFLSQSSSLQQKPKQVRQPLIASARLTYQNKTILQHSPNHNLQSSEHEEAAGAFFNLKVHHIKNAAGVTTSSNLGQSLALSHAPSVVTREVTHSHTEWYKNLNKCMACKQRPFLHNNKRTVYTAQAAPSSWLGSGFYGNEACISVFGHRELRVC